MKLRNIIPAVAMACLTLGFSSCVGDLDVDNINPQQDANYSQDALFNKMYANLSLTGQKGPDGSGDLDDIDEGFSGLIRNLWNANELSTDEAKCIWGDPGIPEFNHNSWSDAHPLMQAMYYRLFFGVTLANYFLQETEGADDANTLTMRAEARFIRALHYYYLMDLYANVPIITTMSKDLATQSSRAEVFSFIESELKDIIGEGNSTEVLADSKSNTYGRADKTAAEMLLARLYLNAEVYTGTARWADAQTRANNVINSQYKLNTTGAGKYSAFQLLFMGDNDTNGAQNEIILPALYDGEQTQSWGGTLFVIASTANSKVTDPALGNYPLGTGQAWGGNHCTKQFVQKFFPNDDAPQGNPFDLAAAAGDDRALFYTLNHELEISDEGDFEKGHTYLKFLNVHSDGSATHHADYVDTDFPLLRVAEAYLTFAEADARQNGNNCTAAGLEKINALRTRAHANTVSSFSLDNICDEWSREFAYEGMRRVVLIRHNKFGGQSNYKWEWMGGTAAGSSFDAHFNIYAIPVSALNANENLKQNPGYE